MCKPGTQKGARERERQKLECDYVRSDVKSLKTMRKHLAKNLGT